MIVRSFDPRFLLAPFGLAAASACLPEGSEGQCSSDDQCPNRGGFCDPISHECEVESGEHPFSEENPPADFTDKVVPFFRGKLCTAKNLAGNSEVATPLTFNPCWHPCMAPGSRQHRTSWQCSGTSCSGFAVFWTEGASGAGCPADAFGKFDPALCDYSQVANAAIGPITVDGVNIEAGVDLEMPFLTTSDIEQIAAAVAADDPGISDLIEQLAEQYTKEDDRVIDLHIEAENPAPPAMCGDMDTGEVDEALCTCADIGFDVPPVPE